MLVGDKLREVFKALASTRNARRLMSAADQEQSCGALPEFKTTPFRLNSPFVGTSRERSVLLRP